MSRMLNLGFSEEQQMLRETIVRLLRLESTPERVRAAKNGHDPALWAKLLEVGVPLIRCPEVAGGLDTSLLETAVVAEEAGRYLAAAPIVETIVAARLLASTGIHGSAILQEIATGAVATIALLPVSLGTGQVIPGGAVAQWLIGLEGGQLIAYRGVKPQALARDGNSSSLALCTPADSDSAIERRILAEGEPALAIWEAAVEEWKLGIAATLVGLSDEAIRRAAAYSKERVQFGKPIGAFQGIAHPLADSITEVEGARLLVWRAIAAVAAAQNGGHREQTSKAAALISMAFWWATEVAGRATERALRTFGGYGLSLDGDIHLFYQRAKALSLIAGDPDAELRRAGDRLYAGVHPPTLPATSPVSIDFEWGDNADAYATRLRRFIEENVDAPLRASFDHSTKSHSKPFTRKLAKAGLLFPDLPVEHGGEGRNPIEVAASSSVWEDLDWNSTGIGLSFFVLSMALRWSSEEARAEIVPRLMSGDAVGCLGFSEPGSGSDIFACQLRATRDSQEWVLQGQKMFTTGGHIADYILLLTRNDNQGKKHEGLTVFLAPMSLPRIEIAPFYTLQDERTNVTFFESVRVPDRYRLGEVGQGMQVMLSALEYEHSGSSFHDALPPMLKHAVNWASEADRLTDPDVRRRLARAATIVEVSECLCRRDVWAQTNGSRAKAFGPMSKLFATEGLRTIAADLVALAAPAPLLTRNDDLRYVEIAMRRSLGMTIYGGTSEIQRSIIAEQHLGMPKSRS